MRSSSIIQSIEFYPTPTHAISPAIQHSELLENEPAASAYVYNDKHSQEALTEPECG